MSSLNTIVYSGGFELPAFRVDYCLGWIAGQNLPYEVSITCKSNSSDPCFFNHRDYLV